jgi:hypothetical protein
MIYLMGTTDRRWQISRLSFLVTLQQLPPPSPVHPGASQTWWSVSQTPTTRSKGEPPNAQTPTTCWTISGDIITLLPCLLKRHLAWHLSKAHLSSRVRIRHHPWGSCILFHPSPIHTRFPSSIGCWTTRWPEQPSYRLCLCLCPQANSEFAKEKFSGPRIAHLAVFELVNIYQLPGHERENRTFWPTSLAASRTVHSVASRSHELRGQQFTTEPHRFKIRQQ